MDWNRIGKLLRPNPDSEEDLIQTCEVTPHVQNRVKSYSEKYKKSVPKKKCNCQSWGMPGVAPRMPLSNGRTIPHLGIGTWLGFDHKHVPIAVTDNSMQDAVEVAIDEGYRLIDTAPSYGTESQVGNAIKKKVAEGAVRREDLFIVTKLPNECHSEKSVVPALKKSLDKLQLDYLDLYLIQSPVGIREDGTFDDIDYVDTWAGMIEAFVEGLTKAIGVSNFNQQQILRLISLTKMKPAVVQIEVNLNLQQAPLIEFCHSHDIVVMASAPFGSVFHMRARECAPPPRTDAQLLLRLAQKYHKTVPQIVLRYLVELGVIPIPKSTKPTRIQTNIQVFDFHLTREEKDLLAGYNRNYRTITVTFWRNSPYNPFEEYKSLDYS